MTCAFAQRDSCTIVCRGLSFNYLGNWFPSLSNLGPCKQYRPSRTISSLFLATYLARSASGSLLMSCPHSLYGHHAISQVIWDVPWAKSAANCQRRVTTRRISEPASCPYSASLPASVSVSTSLRLTVKPHRRRNGVTSCLSFSLACFLACVLVLACQRTQSHSRTRVRMENLE